MELENYQVFLDEGVEEAGIISNYGEICKNEKIIKKLLNYMKN